MAVRAKIGLIKTGYVPGKPKKLVKGQVKTQNMQLLLVMERRRLIEVKGDKCT